MIRHFFLDKTNSIIEGSKQNLGNNPILTIGYGQKIMRGLIHFDIEQIKSLIEDKTFASIEKLKFTLKMTNCFSVDNIPAEKGNRASSFDLMLFRLPCEWDGGRGFDFDSDFWIHDNKSFSQEGSNWYYAKNGISWDNDISLLNLDGSIDWTEIEVVEDESNGGIYSFDVLTDEYNKYINGQESIVVGTQHFDYGMENLSIDITKYILDCVNGECNFGLCLAFIPRFESYKDDKQYYANFFNDNTNTFFHPYVEAIYSDYIFDNRDSFVVGCENDLYLYVSNDGFPCNLDNVPECSIENISGSVRQVGKGLYCAHFGNLNGILGENSIYSDTWSKIALNGFNEDNVELEFSTKPKQSKVMIGSNSNLKNNVTPAVYGINDDEKLNRGEIREVSVDFRKTYTTDKKQLIDSAEWRLYVKDGNREADVFPYQPVEKAYLNNFFIIHTEDLIPNDYIIDIKANIGRETKFYKGILRFSVVSNVSERYE